MVPAYRKRDMRDYLERTKCRINVGISLHDKQKASKAHKRGISQPTERRQARKARHAKTGHQAKRGKEDNDQKVTATDRGALAITKEGRP